MGPLPLLGRTSKSRLAHSGSFSASYVERESGLISASHGPSWGQMCEWPQSSRLAERLTVTGEGGGLCHLCGGPICINLKLIGLEATSFDHR